MNLIYLKKEIAKLGDREKEYKILYPVNGYELGIGKGGIYPGHSHYFFYDIIYSPLGIKYKDYHNREFNCKLVVIPPRTYIGQVEINDFLFIKFCPDNKEVSVPEKTNNVLLDGEILNYSSNTQMKFNWYKSYNVQKDTLEIELKDLELSLKTSKFQYLIKP